MTLIDRVCLKGAESETGLYLIEWNQEDMTGRAEHIILGESPGRQQERLMLQTTGKDGGVEDHQVLPEQTPFVIGRNRDRCQLLIDTDFVSRKHCHIAYSNGNFVLHDHSSNGTHISTEFGQHLHLKRGEIQLMGKGTLAFGKPGSTGEHHVVHFGT